MKRDTTRDFVRFTLVGGYWVWFLISFRSLFIAMALLSLFWGGMVLTETLFPSVSLDLVKNTKRHFKKAQAWLCEDLVENE